MFALLKRQKENCTGAVPSEVAKADSAYRHRAGSMCEPELHAQVTGLFHLIYFA